MRVDRRADLPQAAILDAMARGGLVLTLQGIHDGHDPEEMLYQEALPCLMIGGCLVPGGEILPRLERDGSTGRLDRALLSAVLDRLEADPLAVIGCDVSAASLLYLKDWLSLHALVMARPHLAPRLVIELSETLPLLELSVVNHRILALRALGIRLAIDGFGAHHAAPAMATVRGFDIVKIDGAFLTSVHVGEGCSSLTRIVQAGRWLAPHVVLCGIETADQHDLARHAGASHLQGTFFSGEATPSTRLAFLPAPRAVKGVSPEA